MNFGDEHPLLQIVVDGPEAFCFPAPSFPQCAQALVFIETILIVVAAFASTYKFMTLFFFYVSSRNPATRKAMYFWFFGVLLTCFLLIMQVLRRALESSGMNHIWTVFIGVLDMWPFLLVTNLIIDVFADTGAFTGFEVTLCLNMIKVFWIYSVMLPVIHIWFNIEGAAELQRSAFLAPAYIITALFVIFFAYVTLRIFICEKYIASFFIGASALVKFQFGMLFVILALFLKIALLVWYIIPPNSLDVFWFMPKWKEEVGRATTFFSVTHSLIYVVPYILVALGANFTRTKETGEASQSASATLGRGPMTLTLPLT